LLTGRAVKYGLLELRVASFLNPGDWVARLELASGLASVRLDEPAARELEGLLRLRPSLRADSAVVRLRRDLDARSPAAGDVAEF
jgi:hypothetical protein